MRLSCRCLRGGEGFEPGIRIAWLVRKVGKYAVAVLCFATFRQERQCVFGKRDRNTVLRLLHHRLNLVLAVSGLLDFSPGQFQQIRVTKTAEAAEKECRLDIVLGPIWSIDDFLDLFECEIAAG